MNIQIALNIMPGITVYHPTFGPCILRRGGNQSSNPEHKLPEILKLVRRKLKWGLLTHSDTLHYNAKNLTSFFIGKIFLTPDLKRNQCFQSNRSLKSNVNWHASWVYFGKPWKTILRQGFWGRSVTKPGDNPALPHWPGTFLIQSPKFSQCLFPACLVLECDIRVMLLWMSNKGE